MDKIEENIPDARDKIGDNIPNATGMEPKLRVPCVYKFPHDPSVAHILNEITLAQLEPNEYLGDEIMEFYPALITHELGDLAPTITTLSSFFFTWLSSRFNIDSSTQYESIEESIRKMRSYYKSSFEKIELILMPIHMRNHWSLCIINFDRVNSKIKMFHLDSIFGLHKASDIEPTLKRYILSNYKCYKF